MASKWSIENSANIKMLINMIQTAGGIDEDDNIFLPVEKTEHGFLKISKKNYKNMNHLERVFRICTTSYWNNQKIVIGLGFLSIYRYLVQSLMLWMKRVH